MWLLHCGWLWSLAWLAQGKLSKIGYLWLIQVEDIEGKVEQLLELYLEDRKRLLAILPSPPSPPNASPPSSGNNSGPPPSPPAPPAASSSHHRHKPRPILLGKQVNNAPSHRGRLLAFFCELSIREYVALCQVNLLEATICIVLFALPIKSYYNGCQYFTTWIDLN